ncbi:PEPxxWA-CTERM sorting domain-containing protein [Sphingomonas sp. BK235]|jgi:hypothetical protein|uniref:PEPxxWA-CTERM sorting domain-containing protein n=1 Tax=Sphingomonas sp. BK235 TaxID=2512131 RepID=UPI0010EE218E|nr:PEPxxWA-CTERM sorting domain-containing protein [Sphingomonas sp. BK235]TCP33592.1 putative secreted protein with PEP-CTERM sorting signal [Sphingomonas sp. BK235]
MKRLALLVLATLAATPAAAANIVTNAGFENGATGWYVDPTPGSGALITAFAGAGRASDGYAVSGCVGAACTASYGGGFYIGQALTTVAGSSYDLSLWVAETAAGTSGFSVYWNGALVDLIADPNHDSARYDLDTDRYVTSYRQFTFKNLLATGGATDLRIHGRQDQGGILFDDVSVTAAGAPGAVPEPATWAMMLIGFAGIGQALRRRRTAVAAPRHA